MADYNQLRAGMGFPVDFELGRTMAHFNQERRKHVLAATKNLVVPIKTSWTSDNGPSTMQGNGFFYHEGSDHILSCAHLTAPTAIYHARLFNATEVELEVVFAEKQEDVAVFRVKAESEEVPPHPPRPRATTAKVGDTCFIVGFKPAPLSTAELSFSEGVVSYVADFTQSGCRMLVTAYADNGLSGSPVLNLDGLLIGMVKMGDGETIKQAVAIPATMIYSVLRGVPEIPNIVS
mmetsp:Transcript_3841/g.10889  ORF Transcript_3841/g.10889 Transcript_3841/m.10889 type:complete len:234 (-) Transcript_3841:116-817(-)|eukprot:CAMPEP_0117682120 /NCGR_PEP_ID=MMETSP0804-20121206/19438_1 /TAXON_ID=1074897 /ORGANISM="Tetraselmis astigmatica, Strain CCMP880" /LENGTH=233 /DNA_ID=CAMNT_0005492107 /DNA_START=607 /DNA_END=1308 /DNA_ORIENTATION=+